MTRPGAIAATALLLACGHSEPFSGGPPSATGVPPDTVISKWADLYLFTE